MKTVINTKYKHYVQYFTILHRLLYVDDLNLDREAIQEALEFIQESKIELEEATSDYIDDYKISRTLYPGLSDKEKDISTILRFIEVVEKVAQEASPNSLRLIAQEHLEELKIEVQ